MRLPGDDVLEDDLAPRAESVGKDDQGLATRHLGRDRQESFDPLGREGRAAACWVGALPGGYVFQLPVNSCVDISSSHCFAGLVRSATDCKHTFTSIGIILLRLGFARGWSGGPKIAPTS